MIPRDRLMRGNSTLRRIIAEFLTAQMPARIQYAREMWGIEDWHLLPDVAKFDGYDPFTASADNYPLMGCYVTGTTGFVRQDITRLGNKEYGAVYETTLFVATRNAHLGLDADGYDTWEQPGYDSAMRMRDDYMGLLRSTLLDTPSLGTADREVEDADIQENSLRESYPEPIKIGDERNPVWVATGIININVRLTETLSAIPLGSADSIQVETHHVPVDRSLG